MSPAEIYSAVRLNSLRSGREEPERGSAEGQSLVSGSKSILNLFIRIRRDYFWPSLRARKVHVKPGLVPHITLVGGDKYSSGNRCRNMDVHVLLLFNYKPFKALTVVLREVG